MIDQYIKNYIQDNDIISLKISLKDSVIYDPSFKQYDEIYNSIVENIGDIYETHNGEKFEFSIENITKDELNRQLGLLMINFSKERIEFIREMCKILYNDKIEKDQKLHCNRKNKYIKTLTIGVILVVIVLVLLVYRRYYG